MKLTEKYLTKEQIKERVDKFHYVYAGTTQIGIIVRDKKGRYGWSLYNEKKRKNLPVSIKDC